MRPTLVWWPGCDDPSCNNVQARTTDERDSEILTISPTINYIRDRHNFNTNWIENIEFFTFISTQTDIVPFQTIMTVNQHVILYKLHQQVHQHHQWIQRFLNNACLSNCHVFDAPQAQCIQFVYQLNCESLLESLVQAIWEHSNDI